MTTPQLRSGKSAFQRVVSTYQKVAVLLLNTLILFVLVNLGLWVHFAMKDRRTTANPFLAHSDEWLTAAYPGMATSERTQLLNDHWRRYFQYDDYNMFSEGPLQSKYLNVTEAGFRASRDQGPWPPSPENFNIFVFGGSTMFGTGVGDDETVASVIQTAASQHFVRKVCVYNFGTCFYYSTQERIRLERLLAKGFVPNVAVFVDGLNDFIQTEDTPAFRDRYVDIFDVANHKRNAIGAILQELPIGRLANGIRLRFQPPTARTPELLEAQAERVITAYRRNRAITEAICRGHDVVPIFVWQPIPAYAYDLKFFPWYDGQKMHQLHSVGYPKMKSVLDQGLLGNHFLWCADLSRDQQECLYMDVHHYTARFSKRIGEHIVEQALYRGLIKPEKVGVSPK
jgi:lysophospholipase L1-like esterase